MKIKVHNSLATKEIDFTFLVYRVNDIRIESDVNFSFNCFGITSKNIPYSIETNIKTGGICSFQWVDRKNNSSVLLYSDDLK